MKKCLFILSLILVSCAQKSDVEILEETITKLNNLKTIQYDAKVDYYPKEKDSDRSYTGEIFYDFTSKDTLLGAKYHYKSDRGGVQIFDGDMEYSISSKDKRVMYVENPKMYQLTSSIFSGGSITEIKSILPLLLKDTTIQKIPKVDSIINNEEVYNFKFVIPERYVADNALLPVNNSEKYTQVYELFISKNTKLPVFVRTKNSISDQVTTSAMSNFSLTATRHDSIWDFQRLQNEYLVISEREFYGAKRQKLQKLLGNKAPDFELPNIDGTTVSLSSIKEELILLEFWFVNCGPCVAAIPEIESIKQEYSEKGLGVYGIEFNKAPKDKIKKYIEKHKIEIPTLYQGNLVADAYGVFGAPTFVLINNKKEVIYSKISFDKEELIKEIEKYL